MRVLDLFAGSGIGVAVHRLGWTETGVEVMPEAIQTRQKLGWETLLEPDGSGTSVADLPNTAALGYAVLAGGPPCQTFSLAGGGEGRANLDRVLEGIKVVASGKLFRPPAGTDPRTWLVLEPLRIALHSRPRFIMLEQVPTVRPVWEAYAEVLEHAHGYSVWTGDLQAEMYGVPQTRKRRILIARLDGKQAAPPVPTHSRYYGTNPERMDPGVLPWVSMAEALGWGTTGRPSFTVTGGGASTGGAEPYGRRARESLLAYRNGSQENAAVRGEEFPAPTVHQSARSNAVEWIQRSNYTSRSATKSTPSPVPGSLPLGKREMSEPSHTLTSKAHKWVSDAATVRVTPEEAAILQSFPAGHPFQGSRGKQYLQIGNAMPPRLAEAVLRTFL